LQEGVREPKPSPLVIAHALYNLPTSLHAIPAAHHSLVAWQLSSQEIASSVLISLIFLVPRALDTLSLLRSAVPLWWLNYHLTYNERADRETPMRIISSLRQPERAKRRKEENETGDR
jgi:hypothetical protein